jgi:hypothetical protein
MNQSHSLYEDTSAQSRVVDLLPREDGVLDDAVRVVGVLFRLLTDSGSLPRFDAEWSRGRDLTLGKGNCHTLARILCEELQAQGLPAKWVSATISADLPRRAMSHSWVELNGVAIEMSDGEIHIGHAGELRELSAATDVVEHASVAGFGSSATRSAPPSARHPSVRAIKAG